MESKEAVRVFLLEYIKKQTQLELTDLIKLLYQSAFGCGHFAPDEARVLEYLEIEMETMRADRNAPLDENVLGGYARVNIAPYAARGMETKTLARLFMKTANAPLEGERKAWFDEMLSLLGEMAQAGELPFAQEDVCDAVAVLGLPMSSCSSVPADYAHLTDWLAVYSMDVLLHRPQWPSGVFTVKAPEGPLSWAIFCAVSSSGYQNMAANKNAGFTRISLWIRVSVFFSTCSMIRSIGLSPFSVK